MLGALEGGGTLARLTATSATANRRAPYYVGGISLPLLTLTCARVHMEDYLSPDYDRARSVAERYLTRTLLGHKLYTTATFPTTHHRPRL